jgi:hypothetical protein
MNKYPEAASVAQVHKVLSDIEILAKCTPAEVGGKLCIDLRGAVKNFPEWWYSTLMVGHTATII